ncbi:AraC family transcriptional regulator [Fictibacillus fluitans]|uniref:AraC family transcriptional regulator n=1 Tax=Fictibacillus fluitans TaxID=3058422 RepID=A0ABT8HQC2_9BACL|nr:AraC family transcriptional regulator [Fictibacillus sp. NE201]MDN4522956.1 AraC family transcriptional regulator [Fictibacillus sp. NE201]
MTKNDLKEVTYIPDKTFPINIFFINKFPLHWHNHMEWIFIKEGTVKVQIDDTFIHLEKGELAFVNPKQLHAATGLTDHAEIAAIVFNDALLRNTGLDCTEHLYLYPYFNNELKLQNFLRKDEIYTNELSRSISCLINEFEVGEIGYELLVKAELFRIFGLIFRYYHQLKEQPPAFAKKAYHLTSLLKFLREHYNQEISIQEAAKMVNLSPNHFCKVFKKITGKTLIEYLHLLRINEAEKMLIESDASITEIAGSVGFSSITYFGRVFKKIKNVPPSAIRKK